jgi:hypothetical protein
MQPNFTSHLTPQARQPIMQPQATFSSRFRLPGPPHLIQPLTPHTNHFIDENVFQTPQQPPLAMPGPISYAAAVSSNPTPAPCPK